MSKKKKKKPTCVQIFLSGACGTTMHVLLVIMDVCLYFCQDSVMYIIMEK